MRTSARWIACPSMTWRVPFSLMGILAARIRARGRKKRLHGRAGRRGCTQASVGHSSKPFLTSPGQVKRSVGRNELRPHTCRSSYCQDEEDNMAADSRSLILHQYATSPFSEKVRKLFAHKRAPWFAVEQPNMMPKPELVPLTGGYRRIPV